MVQERACLSDRFASGQPVVVVEVSPPKQADAEGVRACARHFAGKVHALGVSDNREGIQMSALATASLIAGEGVETILHVVTRDRNRVALASDCLGAKALGVRNILCATGTHQTLGVSATAKNVFDIDSVQLLQLCGSLNGHIGANDNGQSISLCLGAAASPYADPPELQLIKLAKKIKAGAKFLVTQPVFDIERFESWWSEVTKRGLQDQAAIIAGIYPLIDAESAKAYADRRPSPLIPGAVLERLSSGADKAAQRQAGIDIAVQTIKRLSKLQGLGGFETRAGDEPEVALEVIEKAGLSVS